MPSGARHGEHDMGSNKLYCSSRLYMGLEYEAFSADDLVFNAFSLQWILV